MEFDPKRHGMHCFPEDDGDHDHFKERGDCKCKPTWCWDNWTLLWFHGRIHTEQTKVIEATDEQKANWN